MSPESQRIRNKIEVERPFSRDINFSYSFNSFLVDNSVGLLFDGVKAEQTKLLIICDNRIHILRAKALEDPYFLGRETRNEITALALKFSSSERSVFIGDRYKLTRESSAWSFKIYSTDEINLEPIDQLKLIKEYLKNSNRNSAR